jgi:hypothetical protein
MSKLENNPLIKLLGPFFQKKWSETTRKQIFMLFFSHLWVIQASPIGLKKVPKGLQVEGGIIG